MLLVTSYYCNRDMLQPDGPLGLNADCTFYHAGLRKISTEIIRSNIQM